MRHPYCHRHSYRHIASLGVALAIAWNSAVAQQQPPTPDPVLGPNAVPTDPADIKKLVAAIQACGAADLPTPTGPPGPTG